MRSAYERIDAMHERARLIRHARDKTINVILGTLSALMLVAIVVLAALPSGMLHTIEIAGETGSSLLDEGVGGYVLVAVISFMAAVFITVLCIKRNNKRRNQDDQ